MKHTTSHLGVQQSPLNYLMNTGFILLGMATALMGYMSLKKKPAAIIFIIVFGTSLALSGICMHAPLSGVPGIDWMDQWHSFFATLTGFSFSLFAFSMMFMVSLKRYRWLSMILFLVAILMPLLMHVLPWFQGVFQRVMFVLAFAYLP